VEIAGIDILRLDLCILPLGIAVEVVAEGVLVAPVLLGLIQGPVGILKQLFIGIARYVFRQKADPDAARHAIVVLLEHQLPHRLRQLPGLFQHHGVSGILHKDQKLVSADPGQHVLPLEQGIQQTGKLPQDLVSKQMAVAVVHVFEKVHVNDQQATGGIGVLLLQIPGNQCLGHPAVIQLGQRVVLGLPEQAALPLLLRGHVLGIAHKHLPLPDILHRQGVRLQVEQLPLFDLPQLQGAVHLAGKQLPQLPAVLRQDTALRTDGGHIALDGPLHIQRLVIDHHGVGGGKIFKQIDPAVAQQLGHHTVILDVIDKTGRSHLLPPFPFYIKFLFS
jgi:hypothetical protein